MENKNSVYLTKGQFVIQAGYIMTYLITSLGIIGNLEVNETTPLYGLIIHFISMFLVIGKLVYWYKKGRLF